MARDQRRLAAIVAADVVGYSRLIGQDESGTLAALKAIRRELIEPKIDAYGGRIVKTTGDGLLLEFPSVVDAVRCVVDAQTEIALRNATIEAEQRIEFRIGVHMGDIVIDGDDILGDGVNVAARLEMLAQPGGICVSDRVQEDLGGKLAIDLQDGGTQTLKNIARPVRAWHWSPNAASPRKATLPVAASTANAPLALPDKPSIAVLPFQNMSGDQQQEYFVDGLVEDIITALSRFKALFVIARNSSFTYRGNAVDVRKVGRELGVRYVLEGSVRRAADRIRITGQLIDSQTGAHLWADRFDGALDDVFDLQDRITAAVAGQLPLKIEQAEIERVRNKSTASLGAYESFLLGMRGLHQSSRESVEQALRHYYQAIELDSEFAEPYAWASTAYSRRKQARWMSDLLKESAEGIRLARRGAELRPDSSRMLSSAGFALAFLGGDIDAGIDFSDRALALNPNDAQAWHGSGWIRCYNGDHDLAIEHIGRAERLSPLDPQTSQYQLAKCMAHYCSRRFDAAVAIARQVVQRHPDLVAGYIHLARSAAMAGHRDESRRAMARALELNPGLRMHSLVGVSVMRRPEDGQLLREGDRLAGMPE